MAKKRSNRKSIAKSNTNKLSAKNFGLAAGTLWGLSVFLYTFASMFWNYIPGFAAFLVAGYPGYSLSIGGAVIGLFYGFIDGFIGLFVLIWLYNWFQSR